MGHLEPQGARVHLLDSKSLPPLGDRLRRHAEQPANLQVRFPPHGPGQVPKEHQRLGPHRLPDRPRHRSVGQADDSYGAAAQILDLLAQVEAGRAV